MSIWILLIFVLSYASLFGSATEIDVQFDGDVTYLSIYGQGGFRICGSGPPPPPPQWWTMKHEWNSGKENEDDWVKVSFKYVPFPDVKLPEKIESTDESEIWGSYRLGFNFYPSVDRLPTEERRFPQDKNGCICVHVKKDPKSTTPLYPRLTFPKQDHWHLDHVDKLVVDVPSVFWYLHSLIDSKEEAEWERIWSYGQTSQ